MTETIYARDLMRREFATIDADRSLGEAMASLRQAQAVDDLPNAVIVVDGNGRFAGLLTAKLLIRIFVGTAPDDDSELLRAAHTRLSQRIGDSLTVDTPAVAPDDRLLTMIRRGLPTRLDFVPVVDDGIPVGLAPITAIFQAAASIALTPDDEGIRFDR